MSCEECKKGKECPKKRDRRNRQMAIFAAGGAVGALAGASIPVVGVAAVVAGLVRKGRSPFPLVDVLAALVTFEIVRRIS